MYMQGHLTCVALPLTAQGTGRSIRVYVIEMIRIILSSSHLYFDKLHGIADIAESQLDQVCFNVSSLLNEQRYCWQ